VGEDNDEVGSWVCILQCLMQVCVRGGNVQVITVSGCAS
jgi:hypothetical protein